jgi:ribonuclease HII
MVAGSDEVGRGALGGPVTAGVVVVQHTTKRPPAGLRDSKMLSAAERRSLVPRIERWASAFAIGHASAFEIDQVGILRALRLAGERALAALPLSPEAIVLDGNYDWFSRPEAVPSSPLCSGAPAVTLKIKADVVCASAAAASVLAKVERDELMDGLAIGYPEYGWGTNKGYATPEHLAVLRELGPCDEHRRSWRLRGPDELLAPEELLAMDADDLWALEAAEAYEDADADQALDAILAVEAAPVVEAAKLAKAARAAKAAGEVEPLDAGEANGRAPGVKRAPRQVAPSGARGRARR